MNPTKVDAWIETRRDIHAHPELRFEENRTASLIEERLRQLGYTVESGIGKTGVVGVLEGRRSNSTPRMIGLRADMDALPIQERNTFGHASLYPGKMHACGHDGHVAMLLGAAQELSETRNFAGTVVLIFQPAEEGGAGAQRMIEDGNDDSLYSLDSEKALEKAHLQLIPYYAWANRDEGQMMVWLNK